MSRRNREKRTAVRGNMATYTAEKPLFGKYVGSVYRPDHERGIAEQSATTTPDLIQEDNLASKMFFNDGYDNEIICPYCGDNDVHFTEARQVSGEDKYAASDVYDIGVRGDVIVIPFYCENGRHNWVLVLGEHKGNIRHKMVLLDATYLANNREKEERNSLIRNDEDLKQHQTKGANLAREMSLTSKMIGKNKGLITLELWSHEANILIEAIVSRQTELICKKDHDYDESILDSLRADLEGQLRMLDIIRKASTQEEQA